MDYEKITKENWELACTALGGKLDERDLGFALVCELKDIDLSFHPYADMLRVSSHVKEEKVTDIYGIEEMGMRWRLAEVEIKSPHIHMRVSREEDGSIKIESRI